MKITVKEAEITLESASDLEDVHDMLKSFKGKQILAIKRDLENSMYYLRKTINILREVKIRKHALDRAEDFNKTKKELEDE